MSGPGRRNRATGEWIERERLRLDSSMIVVEQADMLDTKLGTTYQGGAYRVVVHNVPGKRTRTFLGEQAWCQAGSYASDVATAAGDWRWWPNH
jgi:hypothetical protein